VVRSVRIPEAEAVGRWSGRKGRIGWWVLGRVVLRMSWGARRRRRRVVLVGVW